MTLPIHEGGLIKLTKWTAARVIHDLGGVTENEAALLWFWGVLEGVSIAHDADVAPEDAARILSTMIDGTTEPRARELLEKVRAGFVKLAQEGLR